MIRLSSKNLSKAATSHLYNIQQRINNEIGFQAKVAKAETEWDSKEKSIVKFAAFKEIRDKLTDMCVSIDICNYCENNEATDIEHIYPKSLFPERSFRWDNYLLACKTCNTAYKLDKFAIFRPVGSSSRFDVLRGLCPITNDGVLVNPRIEDPLHFFWLDIQNRTFILDPNIELGTRDYEKATYTLELFKLNNRPALVAARKRAAIFYINRLEQYVSIRESNNKEEMLAKIQEPYYVDRNSSFDVEKKRLMEALKADILECDHPTVWKELIRQRERLPNTNLLLDRANEVLNW